MTYYFNMYARRAPIHLAHCKYGVSIIRICHGSRRERGKAGEANISSSRFFFKRMNIYWDNKSLARIKTCRTYFYSTVHFELISQAGISVVSVFTCSPCKRTYYRKMKRKFNVYFLSFFYPQIDFRVCNAFIVDSKLWNTWLSNGMFALCTVNRSFWPDFQHSQTKSQHRNSVLCILRLIRWAAIKFIISPHNLKR